MKESNDNEFTWFDDDEFIRRFEDCSLRPNCFHHREHIRLTWLYLKRYQVIDALARLSNGIRKFAAALGKADRYHETITWAYIFLIHERMTHAPEEQIWDEFIDNNSDLLDWRDSILKRYYRDDTLSSSHAKKVFILPDRRPC